MSTYQPAPLTYQEFYILIALLRGQLHAYALGAAATNDSLGNVPIKDGTLFPLLRRLASRNLIAETGFAPAGKSGRDRKHYGITSEGRIRLQEELQRMQHAVAIGEAAGLLEISTPPTFSVYSTPSNSA